MLLGIMKLNLGKTAARIAALLMLAALLCAGVQAAVAEENTLTMSVGGQMSETATDPTISRNLIPDVGGYQFYHYFTHMSPLITLDSDGNVIPWMAESYEPSDDYKTITFYLRKGVTFADGTPLNASVLKFNFDRILTYGYAGTNLPIFATYDYSEVVDEYTFELHFTQGWMDMPHALTTASMFSMFISPEDVDPEWDIEGTLKPDKMYNGLGPYYVDENESILKEKVVLKRRSSWRDDLNFHKPSLDQIVLTYIADPQIAVMALESGDIDYICRLWNAPLDSLPQLENNPKVSIKTAPETRMYFLRTAYWTEPFSGEDGIVLRKAICYALNRAEMVEGAFYGYARPATDAIRLSSMKPDSPECCHKGYDYDLDLAKKLLAEAGWSDTDDDGILDKNGKALKDLDMMITTSWGMVWQEDLALIVQSQLKEIGIDVEIQLADSGGYAEAMKAGDFDMAMAYGVGNLYTSTQELEGFNQKGDYINVYSNQDQTLETIVEKTHDTLSKEELDEYLCQACDILYEEAGIIPLVYEEQYAIMSTKVKVFQLGPSQNAHYLDYVEEWQVEG